MQKCATKTTTGLVGVVGVGARHWRTSSVTKEKWGPNESGSTVLHVNV